MEKQRRYLVIGAHPDDCEKAAGITLKLVKAGAKVKYLCATNGFSGHHEHMGGDISQIRLKEAQAVAEFAGIEYEFLDNNDAFLTTDLPTRHSMLKAIREWAPDVIMTHRPNDYHPDHRNTSLLVQDCSYLVQVPNVLPLTPVLRYQPVIFYTMDNFQKPYPFQPTIVFDIDDVHRDKMWMYHLYTSQFYEWLPWIAGNLDEVPAGDEARFEWLMQGIDWVAGGAKAGKNLPPYADRWRDMLVQKYGEKGNSIRYVEGLELCEYGGQPTAQQMDELFPF